MRLHRFYVNFPLGEEVVVENVDGAKELIHQWTSVFRYTSGDEVILFSSSTSGLDFHYTFSSISKQAATLGLTSSSQNIIPKEHVTLCMALVKKDTFETIVRQATELGVSRIIPVLASRSEKKNLNFERLSAIATEACEQSGRGTIPEIGEICTLDEAIHQTEGVSVVGSLSGKPLQDKIPGPITLWVGPEGGWTEEEEELFRSKGYLFLSCAQTVLKADTAAVALLAKLV